MREARRAMPLHPLHQDLSDGEADSTEVAPARCPHNQEEEQEMSSPMYLHCKTCFDQRPSDVSPEQWARLSVCTDMKQLRVECVRCQKTVTILTIRRPRR